MVGLEDFHGIHCDSVAVYVRQSHLQARKSNMAAKNQDGGRKFLFLSTKKLSKVLKNYHTKNGAWSQSVTGISTIASTIKIATQTMSSDADCVLGSIYERVGLRTQKADE